MDYLKRRVRGFASRKQALVLTYHSIQKQPLPFRVWCHLAEEKFQAQISYLASNFRCVSLSMLLTEMESGHILPYTVAVTFDDGFRDNVTTALPILQQHQVPATIFLTTDFVGSTQLLWPEQIACLLALTKKPALDFAGMTYNISDNVLKGAVFRQLTGLIKEMKPNDIPQHLDALLNEANVTPQQLRASPWHENLQAMDWCEAREMMGNGLIDIGAHTLSHRRLSGLSSAEAEHEISGSKRVLEQHLGPVHYFAYPYGESHYTDEHRAMAIRAGYRAILTTDRQTVRPTTDPYAVPRIGIGADVSLDQFAYMLHGGAARANSA